MNKEEIISVMKRYELKYRLSSYQLKQFQEKILEYMKIDKYGLTSIISLYYDTPSFTLINRSIEKPKYKEKIRLRSYGLANANTKVFLEIKRKNEGIVYKRRITLKEDEADAFINGNLELKGTQISRELEAFKENHRRLEAKYLIIYDRIAYYQDDSDLRITVDKNPRYRVSDLNLHTSTNGISLLEENEAILEVKVQHSVPYWLAKILSELKIYQTSFSKVGTAHKLTMSKILNEKAKGDYKYGFAI